MKTTLMMLSAVIALVFTNLAKATEVVISGVPSYINYHGCTPTSVGMILGYYDKLGYTNLFSASGADLYLTDNVQDQISSTAHNAKYDPVPDISNAILPIPSKTSIADYLGTSVDKPGVPGFDPTPFGVSPTTGNGAAIIEYTASKGYAFTTAEMRYSSPTNPLLLWNTLVTEITNKRPMLFLVDTDGNNSIDHALAAIGYKIEPGNEFWYACYTTAREGEYIDTVPGSDYYIDWKRYQPKAVNNKYGVYGGVAIMPPSFVPEPSSSIVILLLSVGVVFNRRRATC